MTGPARDSPGIRISERFAEIRERYPDDPVVQAAMSEVSQKLDDLVDELGRLRQQGADLAAARAADSEEGESWRQVFERAPVAMMVTDRNGILVDINRNARDFLGLTAVMHRRNVAKPLILQIAPTNRQGFQRMLRNPVSKGSEPLIVQLRGKKATDSRGELWCSLVDDNRLVWMLHDVSDAEHTREMRESAIAKEKAAAEQLRAVDAVRRAFILSVSHDLHAPIAAVAGLASVLDTQDLDEQARRRVVKQLEASARSTTTMLRDLLDYQRAEEAVTPPHYRRTDVAECVRHAVSTVDTDDHILELDLPTTVANVDVTITNRIVSNLVRNAVQHTPAGTTIWIRCRREPDGVLLVAEDDGPGIPSDLRHTVFDLFQRSRSDPRTNGLGVGLALVRRFAVLHGGYARVEERSGGGASFQIVLADSPIRDAGVAEGAPANTP